ncbi:interleukin-17 receptor E isoform X2 [Erpetoichthys calabaricus]|nr:interleukin-17 receptor E isoform X2 [Erpetoichthys calabaricus]
MWSYTVQTYDPGRKATSHPEMNESFHSMKRPSAWELRRDCFVAHVQNQGTYNLEKLEEGPVFGYIVDKSNRTVTVSVYPGPPVKARLCYKQRFMCDDLESPAITLINTSWAVTATLHFSFALPCLCVEVFYLQSDALRQQVMIFQDYILPSGHDFMHSSTFKVSHHSEDEMSLTIYSKCSLNPSVSLCWREDRSVGILCQEFAHSTLAGSDDSVYRVTGIDKHPQMCFKVSFAGSDRIECPHNIEPVWNVEVTTEYLLFHLYIDTSILASFNAVLCSRQLSNDSCEPVVPVHTITKSLTSENKTLHMVLNAPVQGLCVQIWRSDVPFAGNRTICPDCTKGRLGLIASLLMIGVIMILIGFLFSYAWIQSYLSATNWTDIPLLLVYSADSEEYVSLICTLASLLREQFCCQVRLDCWDHAGLAQLGPLPWLYRQQQVIKNQHGRILLVWSQGSQTLYENWKKSSRYLEWPVAGLDTGVIFQAALACIHSDLQKGAGTEYSLLYFSRLYNKYSLPEVFKQIPQYNLSEQLGELLMDIQGRAFSKNSCLKITAGILTYRVAHSDIGQKLKERTELCSALLDGKKVKETKGVPECNQSDRPLISSSKKEIMDKMTVI